ncbi:MAG: hypothetical protein ACXWKX_20450 [Caulobacteraceae bacterium]
MRRHVLAAALALAAMGGEARAADEGATGADLRCVSVFAALVNSPQYRQGAAAGIYYYVGRIEGRDPTFDLGKGLNEVRSSLEGRFQSEAQRCGAEFKAKHEALKAIGGQLQRTRRGVG